MYIYTVYVHISKIMCIYKYITYIQNHVYINIYTYVHISEIMCIYKYICPTSCVYIYMFKIMCI